MRKLILWGPVLMVGSLMYWTMALHFGSLSLVALSAFAIPATEELQLDSGDRDIYQPISVNLADEAMFKATLDSETAAGDVTADREGPRSEQRGAADRSNDQGPGQTAF